MIQSQCYPGNKNVILSDFLLSGYVCMYMIMHLLCLSDEMAVGSMAFSRVITKCTSPLYPLRPYRSWDFSEQICCCFIQTIDSPWSRPRLQLCSFGSSIMERQQISIQPITWQQLMETCRPGHNVHSQNQKKCQLMFISIRLAVGFCCNWCFIQTFPNKNPSVELLSTFVPTVRPSQTGFQYMILSSLD